jgi:hypothetical protein
VSGQIQQQVCASGQCSMLNQKTQH